MSHATPSLIIQPAARFAVSSALTRFGLKGSGAIPWLEKHAIPVPSAANRISRWNAGRCLRLGHGEFLIELDEPGIGPLAAGSTQAATDNAWPLLRSDHSLVLRGDAWPALLARICSFDFRRFREEPDLVVMTLMAGIAVTLVAERPASTGSIEAGSGDAPFALRLWCDASYAACLDHCLQILAAPSSQGDRP